MATRVRIVEVGPRDGLQNEAASIATADKVAFVDRLSDAGHRVIEVSAFVSPKWVPQMADAAEVFARIARRPGQVPAVVHAVAGRVPIERIALHFHDTRGTALANVVVALQLGIGTFDASAGGLGGCPYAPGATGNLATEDLLYMLDGMDIETGVSLDKVLEASRFIEQRIGHPLASRYAAAVRGHKA